MWIRTRQNLVSLPPNVPFEIGIHKVEGVTPFYRVLAYETSSHVHVKVRLLKTDGLLRVFPRGITIACIPESNNWFDAYKSCIEKLQLAIESKQPLCDLSEVGFDEPWGIMMNIATVLDYNN